MKLLKKLRKKIECVRKVNLRKSRKIGIFVERKETRTTINKANSLQSSSGLKPVRPIERIPCENVQNNILCIWKCSKNEDRIRILKFRQKILLGNQKKVGFRPRSKSRRRIQTLKKYKNDSTAPTRPLGLGLNTTQLEKVDEASCEETNLNQSARDDNTIPLIPRSKSDENHNQVCVIKDANKCSLFSLEDPELFLKYIPVDNDYRLIRRKIRDERIGSTWLEIQAWCTKYQAKRDKEKQTRPVARQSQTLLQPQNRKQNFSIYADEIDCHSVKEPSVCENDILHHPRFGYHSNQSYFQAIVNGSSSKSRSNRIQFCIAPEVLSSTIQLCHQKTEMILICIRSFLKCFADIEVMWVDSLEKHLPTKSLKSCFPLDIGEILDRSILDARAVLYVTEDVATILRHPDTYFLSTLAYTAGIKRQQLIVLPLHVKPKHFSVVKR